MFSTLFLESNFLVRHSWEGCARRDPIMYGSVKISHECYSAYSVLMRKNLVFVKVIVTYSEIDVLSTVRFEAVAP